MMKSSTAPFQEHDAILDPNVAQSLTHYLDNGGDINQACESLSQSYQGFQDMIQVMMSWFDTYADGTHAFQQALSTILNKHEQSLIHRLDDTLLDSHRAQPVLSKIASSPHWKPVVSTIADRHRRSALYSMLNRQVRLVHAGIEPADMQSPASFLTALCHQFTALFRNPKSPSDADIQNLYNRVSAICVYDECTAVVALRFFSDLSRTAEQPLIRGLFRRVAEEIRKQAIAVMSAAEVVSPVTARHYVLRLSITVDWAAAGVAVRKPYLDAILTLMTSTSRKPLYGAEINILIQAYHDLLGDFEITFFTEFMKNVRADAQPSTDQTALHGERSPAEKAMLIQTLCHVEVFEDLLLALFTNAQSTNRLLAKPKETTDQNRRKCLSLLLAYGAVFICKDPKEVVTLMSETTPEERITAMRGDVKKKYMEVELLATAAQTLYPGCARFELVRGDSKKIILEGISDPFLARAVLIWAREGLSGSDDPHKLVMTAPIHLCILKKIAKDHPVLRHQVLEAIREAFKREFSSLHDTLRVDRREVFMKCLVGMVSIQMGPELVHEFLKYYADDSGVDDSLRRLFVGGVLESIQPPYSHSFAKLVVRLLQHQRTAAIIETDPRIASMALRFRKEAYTMGVS